MRSRTGAFVVRRLNGLLRDSLKLSYNGHRRLPGDAVDSKPTASLNAVDTSSDGGDLQQSSLLIRIEQKRFVIRENGQRCSDAVGAPIGDRGGKKQLCGCARNDTAAAPTTTT